jgi:hypothetical protein
MLSPLLAVCLCVLVGPSVGVCTHYVAAVVINTLRVYVKPPPNQAGTMCALVVDNVSTTVTPAACACRCRGLAGVEMVCLCKLRRIISWL